MIAEIEPETEAETEALALEGVEERHYQHEAVDAILGRWDAGDTATLLILPTGTGKTIVAGMVATRLRAREGGRLLFLAHREELIHQAVDKIGSFGLDCAIEMADQNARSGIFQGLADVVVATVQTLQGARLAAWPRDGFGAIVTDEAHHARADSYRRIYDHFAGTRHLGITATPDRGDDRNLGAVYQSIAYEYSLRRAIEEGYLVPLTTARLETGVDLRDIRTTGGDFNQADLEARIAPHIEPLADATAREVGDRPTVVFTPDVGSAEAMANALAQKGLAASDVSGRMARPDRRAVLRRFAEGGLQVLCCCDLLTEGWDCPRVSAIVVCRPTRKRSRYAQMIGRGTRPHPQSSKADCLIVDFAWQTTAKHQLVQAIELFDDSQTDDAVLDLAAKLMEEKQIRDPREALDEAERFVADARKFRVRLTGRRAAYKKIVFDPVGVGQILNFPVKRDWDWNPAQPATPKQVALLARLGLTDPGELSRIGASRRIDFLMDRCRQGLATLKQVALLQSLGVDPEQARTVTFAEASRTLDELLSKAPPRA